MTSAAPSRSPSSPPSVPGFRQGYLFLWQAAQPEREAETRRIRAGDGQPSPEDLLMAQYEISRETARSWLWSMQNNKLIVRIRDLKFNDIRIQPPKGSVSRSVPPVPAPTVGSVEVAARDCRSVYSDLVRFANEKSHVHEPAKKLVNKWRSKRRGNGFMPHLEAEAHRVLQELVEAGYVAWVGIPFQGALKLVRSPQPIVPEQPAAESVPPPSGSASCSEGARTREPERAHPPDSGTGESDGDRAPASKSSQGSTPELEPERAAESDRVPRVESVLEPESKPVVDASAAPETVLVRQPTRHSSPPPPQDSARHRPWEPVDLPPLRKLARTAGHPSREEARAAKDLENDPMLIFTWLWAMRDPTTDIVHRPCERLVALDVPIGKSRSERILKRLAELGCVSERGRGLILQLFPTRAAELWQREPGVEPEPPAPIVAEAPEAAVPAVSPEIEDAESDAVLHAAPESASEAAQITPSKDERLACLEAQVAVLTAKVDELLVLVRRIAKENVRTS